MVNYMLYAKGVSKFWLTKDGCKFEGYISIKIVVF